VNQASWSSDRRSIWRQFLSTSTRIVDRLDHELQLQHDLALVDFEILDELDRAPGGRLRMSELANQVLVSRSRLTYRIDRLADVGHVTREECEDDRRGMWAIITETGRAACDTARLSHEAAVGAWFFEQMSADEQRTCHAVMQRIDRES
jgi:DNA-binding MarR family transcriptional regulator